jgi:antitoxin component YwqK of YwqJK toxin-antitoxin module
MRRLFLFLFFTFSLLSCESINDTNKRNANWIWWVDAKTAKGSWVPAGDGKPIGKTGNYIMFYFNGHVAERGKLINGQHVDTTFFYCINGERQGYMLYKMANQVQDTVAYFYNDGPIKMFRENGLVRAIGVIKNHTYGDKWASYYKNGKLGFKKDLKQDTGWITRYYDNGKVQDSEYVEGINVYVIKRFYPLGQIKESFEFKNHNYNGPVKQYFLNGRLEGVCTMVNGQLNGKQVAWFEDGHLKGVSHRKNGVFDGPDTVFYENGKINVVGCMSNGKVNGEYREFDESGRLIAYDIVKDGVTIENKLLEQLSKPPKSK